jgi:hypothetical protein
MAEACAAFLPYPLSHRERVRLKGFVLGFKALDELGRERIA